MEQLKVLYQLIVKEYSREEDVLIQLYGELEVFANEARVTSRHLMVVNLLEYLNNVIGLDALLDTIPMSLM
ncbi:hypothetical protein GOP47_0006503 [Adiantum capillus-veneris]|uniref:Uncharacterized protein n=1 Tax=Adiantum capillus-veneris TaxID=13818 RepID=A0A9D4ZM41_ADICA|nr:hypothetical protein GOP47_0006503 [Adiantum capillus-veneris]